MKARAKKRKRRRRKAPSHRKSHYANYRAKGAGGMLPLQGAFARARS